MSASSRSLGGSVILLSILAFVYGGASIYRARRDIAVARNERTANGQARLHPQSKDPSPFDSLRCDYTFIVNDTFYNGYGICPRQTDRSIKGTLENVAGLLQNQNVTVYYDPADPSFNSMMEFGAKSEYDYKKAELSFVAGAALLIFTAIGALYFSGANNASQGVVGNSEGTVIYPDKIDSDRQEFAAHPGRIGPEKEQTDHSAND
jgi:hypothetical protein